MDEGKNRTDLTVRETPQGGAVWGAVPRLPSKSLFALAAPVPFREWMASSDE